MGREYGALDYGGQQILHEALVSHAIVSLKLEQLEVRESSARLDGYNSIP